MEYLSTDLLAYLLALYFIYQVFFLMAETNFPKKVCSNPNGPFYDIIIIFIKSYHFTMVLVRYPSTI